MSQTLFLKDNTLYIRLKEGEYEVSNSKQFGSPDFIRETFDFANFIEWPGGVELINHYYDKNKGVCGITMCYSQSEHIKDKCLKWCKTVARLLPEEKKDTGAHSYTESAYKEGESSDQETECKEVDCKCQPGICLRSVREICATEYTEAIEKACSNANMITEKLYRYLRGNPDSTHIDFRDFFIKELNDISAPSESQEEMWDEVVSEITFVINVYVEEYTDSSHDQRKREIEEIKKELSERFTITRKPE